MVALPFTHHPPDALSTGAAETKQVGVDINAHLRMYQGKHGAPAYDLEPPLAPFRVNLSFWHATMLNKLAARVADQQQQRIYSFTRSSLKRHSLWCKHRRPTASVSTLVREAVKRNTDSLCTRPWWRYFFTVVKRSLLFAKEAVHGDSTLQPRPLVHTRT